MKNIHFLLTITRREDSEAFVDFFNSRDLSCIYSAYLFASNAIWKPRSSISRARCSVWNGRTNRSTALSFREAAQRKFYAICPPKCRSICRIAASPLPFRS